MPGAAKSSGVKSGSGKASPAALFEDDGKEFREWKRKKRPNRMIEYDKSPAPVKRPGVA